MSSFCAAIVATVGDALVDQEAQPVFVGIAGQQRPSRSKIASRRPGVDPRGATARASRGEPAGACGGESPVPFFTRGAGATPSGA
jgi:hypothetical protein